MNTNTISAPTNALQDIADDQFTVACRQAAAIMARPEYNGRLEKAMDLVLSGKVTLHDDFTTTVKSGAHTYEILDQCTCQDAQHRTLYCKHFLAAQLLKRTYERMGQLNGNGHRNEPAPQADAESAPWLTAQAPSSCTLKWAVGGIELMLTLRDATDQALFNRIGKVLPRIEEKMETQRQQRQAERKSQQDSNGASSSGEIKTTLPNDDDGWCQVHQEPMYRHTKGNDVWYSHRTESGKWCRGK